ncbi:MAG: hypothetical protein EBX41_00925 [Chitinophagia bacterium]|nr:hypothetical protein [Chitinophagia bacterium]
MNKIYSIGSAFVGLLCCALFFACNPKYTETSCKAVMCAHGGVCNAGECRCPPGYEGTLCETQSSEKMLSTWVVIETGSITGRNQYTIAIQQGSAANEIKIGNLYNYFQTPIRATVSKDSIYIPNQQYQGKVVVGYGGYKRDSGNYPYLYVRYMVIDSATGATDDFGYQPAISGTHPSVWKK